MTILDKSNHPYEHVKSFCHFGAFGGVENYRSRGAHDFYDFPIRPGPMNEAPKSFGGCSGGGLWHLPLFEKDGELNAGQPLFQGLLFYQDVVHNGPSALRCHGPQSIYGAAFSALVDLQYGKDGASG